MTSLDVVIDAVGHDGSDIQNLPAFLLSAVSKAAKELRPSHAAKLTYIYSSGTWVHGENRKDIVSDTTPCTHPPKLVAWRIGQEQAVINDANLNGIVIRPALLYGASKGKVVWYGTPGGRYALIHADDLANLYVRASEQSAIACGKIFDAANDMTESVDDFLAKLAETSGSRGYAYLQPSNRKYYFELFFLVVVPTHTPYYSIRRSFDHHVAYPPISCKGAARMAAEKGWSH